MPRVLKPIHLRKGMIISGYSGMPEELEGFSFYVIEAEHSSDGSVSVSGNRIGFEAPADDTLYFYDFTYVKVSN